METLTLKSPVGTLTLFAENEAIVALEWGEGAGAKRASASPVLNDARAALETYFKTGALDVSQIKLDPHGTPFQKRAWREMSKLKPGQTKSYGDLARTLKTSARALGGACAKNPIPILIPCHRVLGAGGALANYSGGDGPETKRTLLRLEGVDI